MPSQLFYYTRLYCIACNTRSFTEGVGFEQRSDTDTLKRPIRDREQVEVVLEEESALACEIAAADLEAKAATGSTPFVVASEISKTSVESGGSAFISQLHEANAQVGATNEVTNVKEVSPSMLARNEAASAMAALSSVNSKSTVEDEEMMTKTISEFRSRSTVEAGPWLGHVAYGQWQIRDHFIAPALKYVLKGLEESGHIDRVETEAPSGRIRTSWIASNR